MANKTTTLGLTKPLKSEDYNVDDFNNNADKIDAFVKSTNTNIANLEVDIDNHSHVLSGTGIKGVLPVSKGGTGATTAVSARKSLGLGDAAVRGVATAVANENTNLVTSSGVFSALFAKAEKTSVEELKNTIADFNKFCYVVGIKVSGKTQHLDVECDGTNDATEIQNLINSVPEGSIIRLLPGTYKISQRLLLNKAITIQGTGGATQIINTAGGYIMSVTSNYVRIKDIQLTRNSDIMSATSNLPLIEFYSGTEIISDVEISGCLFNLNGMTSCVGPNGGVAGIIDVYNPNSLKNMTQIRIMNNTFWGADYTGRHIDFTKISGNMSLVAGGNIAPIKINIVINKTHSVYSYGQDSNVTDSTGNAISVKNSGGSATVVADENIASDDSNDEVKEAE